MNTPLHLAVMLNDYRLVSALLDYSPDFTILNKDNLSPIDLASFI
jgi:ankyrin repeat protein